MTLHYINHQLLIAKIRILFKYPIPTIDFGPNSSINYVTIVFKTVDISQSYQCFEHNKAEC